MGFKLDDLIRDWPKLAPPGETFSFLEVLSARSVKDVAVT
jgi:hypothetical protein